MVACLRSREAARAKPGLWPSRAGDLTRLYVPEPAPSGVDHRAAHAAFFAGGALHVDCNQYRCNRGGLAVGQSGYWFRTGYGFGGFARSLADRLLARTWPGGPSAVWRQRRTWNVPFALGLLGTAMSAIHVHEYDYVGLVVAAWLALSAPTSALEFAWMAIGVVCLQVPLIGMRLPILFWQPVWLLMLSLRRRRPEFAAVPAIAGTPA